MIEINNCHFSYPDGTPALKGIDLAVRDGEFLLLCGPNGSGKTTLIRLMSGLITSTSGKVRINGLEGVKASKEIGRSVGIVFQDADSQIIGETVEEDVAFGPENMGLSSDEISDRVIWALEMMGLENILKKSCYLLSGGEKKRLSLAGVLAMKPSIILFDEPFSHLDYSGVREILRHMVRLHHEGHTLVVATHDVEKVLAHVDRVAVLYNGELKVAAPPDQIIEELSRFGVRPPCYALHGKEKLSWLAE